MFPLSSLSNLQLRLECPGSAIVQLLRATPVLTTLELEMYEYYEGLPNTPSDGDDGPLIRVCSMLSSETGDSEPLPGICPQLRFLTLVLSVHCDTKKETYTCWLAAIRSMILARARLGRPLRRLSVQSVEVQLYPMLLAHATWAERVESDVLAEYSASLAAHVEDFVLRRPGEDAIAFAEPGAQWDEVERYWTVAQHDQLMFDYD
ncbi:hypothetical protein K466DRAFT_604063 [Polyporus arcularius HHB13444]|uniref:Uncharacterized protein n=1 Tax=Polyporus arcularius HHB13444 TaxID=1314778 RepID=A0A5C3NX55_9APHY|nr:hypothetical protein K466DRAFT_604063 [Polyporus arcularius HHB13444]